jgi:2-keto-4-pentenoate hydratase/2-oxohepta-3-ene-1,7-dioic acid hydratase in catechol pathway
MKPKSAILGPEKPLYYPEFTDELEYECELVVKMHKNGRFIPEKHASKYYNEVSVGIDFTARDLQNKLKAKGLPWDIAKGFDGSAALGKFIPITRDMNMKDLHFELKINNHTVQKGHTADMLFSVDQIVAYASIYFSLNIGDLIFTGTPAGVGQVNVYDHLRGYLGDVPLLDVHVQ